MDPLQVTKSVDDNVVSFSGLFVGAILTFAALEYGTQGHANTTKAPTYHCQSEYKRYGPKEVPEDNI